MSLKDITASVQSQVMDIEAGVRTKKKNLKVSSDKKTKTGTKSVKDKPGNVMKRPAACMKTRSKDDDSLIYRPVKDWKTPRYYGETTIYTDTRSKEWRIKPGCGRRDHMKFVFGKKPREQWANVVKCVKEV